MAEAKEPSDPAEATLTASRALLGIVARSVAPALEVVSLPQFRVLVLLSAAGPTRVGQLAEKVGANPSTFSRSIDRMVAGGWVIRAENPDSRREVLLELTDDGRWLVESVTVRRRRALTTVLERMSPADRSALTSALSAFNTAAGETSIGDLLALGL
ncbi:MarR family winged helix-turn-helix transcriptional regulator [Gryllotalpicola reticulitermitis]|uniref:MarR family winged helix-turn-helix transcriptional regulator n=1 Tax=Gryllotalpicola reticulitermitis TaxID=1184153 RepID=A0ABV8QA48_9MICO